MKSKPRDQEYCGVRRAVIERACPVLNRIAMKVFLLFILNRYEIHLAKDVQHRPGPWTLDSILRDYRFTNVRREHDKQTRLLIKYAQTWREGKEMPFEEQVLNTFLFRAWNNSETFRAFGGPWSAQEIYSPELKEKVRPIYKRRTEEDPKRKWWSAAYNQGGTKHAWKFPAGDGYQRAYKESEAMQHEDWEADIPLRPFHIGPWLKRQDIVKKLMLAKDQQEAFEIIKSVRGFSTFLAYQVFVDLTYIKTFPFSENEFVVAGPGCEKGLNYLFEDRDGMTAEECIFWLRDNFQELSCRYRKSSPLNLQELMWDLPVEDRRMNVMSLENCLCEISKYLRAFYGAGRPKQRYKG